MLDIDEMDKKEIYELLQKVGRGHLGCALDSHPYVVPMHYYFDEPNIYIFTAVGMKTKYMNTNSEVCKLKKFTISTIRVNHEIRECL